jgi:hypothetical protein
MVSPKSGLASTLRLPRPDANPEPLHEGTDVVIYGARHRGATGVVVIGSSDFRGTFSRIGDIGVSANTGSGESISYRTDSLTERGDCGALYLNTTTGYPIAMHHCLQNPQDEGAEDTPKGFISFGIPLSKTMSKHTLLGRHSEQEIQDQQLYSPSAAANAQTRNMAMFKTKRSTKIPRLAGTSHPPRQSPNIAKFRTRRIFIDANGNRVSAPPKY